MQGQRTTVDSFSMKIGFDHGSSSSNTSGAPQFLNMQNPIDNMAPDYLASSSNGNVRYASAGSYEAGNLNGCLGESSSNENTINQFTRDELKPEHGWSSSLTNSGVASRLEERRDEATNNLSLGSINIHISNHQAAAGQLSMPNSRSSNMPRNLNLNCAYVDESGGGGGEITESGVSSDQHERGGSETERIRSASCSSDPCGDGRPGCSLDGQRLSCKRKTLEGGDAGRLCLDGNPNDIRHAENSARHAVPAHSNTSNNSSSMSTPPSDSLPVNHSESLNTQFGIRVRNAPSSSPPTSSVVGAAESSHRNSRLRLNPSYQQELPPSNLSTVNALRHSSLSLPVQPSPHILHYNHHVLNYGLPSVNTTSAIPSHVIHPSFQQHVHPAPWNRASTSRVGGSPSSVITTTSEGPYVIRGEVRSSHIPGTVSQHPMFLPVAEMRNLTQDTSNWVLPNANISIPGNPGPPFRVGSSSGFRGPFAPTWVPQHTPVQYPQQLTEVPRPLQLSTVAELSDPGRQFPLLVQSGSSASLQEMGHQEHHLPPRPAARSNRRGGIAAAVQALAASAEERRRLLSEIRNVLAFIRRGTDVNLEEFAINLNRASLFGITELNDRHRDMRLEIDDMSYEELLALEERIGNVKTGLNEETIVEILKQRKYSSLSNRDQGPSEVEPCCVCQEEYIEGEHLGVLDCGHDFHTGCIKRWLMEKNSCPICKTKGLVTGEEN